MTTDATSNQITPEGLEALRQELEHLEETRRKEIAERIRTARAFGDLKENSEYHDAKNEQAFLETKIAKLRERLTQAVVVEGDQGSGARFGSQVTLRDEESGKEVAYRLVGATEANLSEGKLSIESPVAQAVVGRGVGDQVKVPAPGGERAYTVVAIR
jgi:transcription elongation factor GreA